VSRKFIKAGYWSHFIVNIVSRKSIKAGYWSHFIVNIYNKMRSVPSLNRLTRHYMYNKMRSVPWFQRQRHYIYNKMRAVPSLFRHGTLYLQWNRISTQPLFTRDTIFTIKWDQHPAFIDKRHYIYNKMRSVPNLYRHETLYLL
jgi:hypothetical protein